MPNVHDQTAESRSLASERRTRAIVPRRTEKPATMRARLSLVICNIERATASPCWVTRR